MNTYVKHKWIKSFFGGIGILSLLLGLGAALYGCGGGGDGGGVAAGSLDTSFNGTGKVTTDISSGGDTATAVAIQPDGQIVAAGSSSTDTDPDFALVRYNADGSLDPSFNTTGMVTTPGSSYVANAVAIQWIGPEMKIVVAGSSYIGIGTLDDFTLVRYDADGSLDTSFDTDGKVTTAIGSSYDIATAVAIQPDGKIVAAGYSSNGTDYDFALARYNTNGSLDTSFGADPRCPLLSNCTGKVTTPIGSIDDYAAAVAIQPDGKIVVAGYSSNGSNDDFALVRYNAGGSLDTSFDTDGIVTTPIGSGRDRATAVAIQSNGKIVAAGRSRIGSNDDFALVRYMPDGSLDTSFGTGGIVTTDIGSGYDGATAVAIQSDGKIVAAGYANIGGYNDFALVRYNADGSLDRTFNADGKVTTPIGSSADVAAAVAIQSDDKIVAAGYSDNGTDSDFALARYWP